MELKLDSYINAGYSVLYIETSEESRISLNILDTAKKLNRKIRIWSCTEGLRDKDGGNVVETITPVAALNAIQKDSGEIFILKDFHPYLEMPMIRRLLRDIARDFKQISKTIIIISPSKKIPLEIQRDITLLDFPLPNKVELEKLYNVLFTKDLLKSIGGIDEDLKDKIVQSAMGLTSNEAENAFAKAIVECEANSKKIPKLVLLEKANAIKKSGILELFESDQTINDIGGLDNLKNWLTLRSKAYSKEARQFGLPLPRGILICGLPGTGKSLCAKVTANLWDIPLIRFDISKVFAGLVGESESNWRSSIAFADAIGNCVLWFDELEKGISGMASSGKTDGGTSTRIFGNFLTWMQEKKSPVFIIATVNQISNLPPELIRKGRFDEIFYVGLPSPEERHVILNIHISKFKRDPANFNLKKCVECSEDFSGAELEEAIITGLYNAFEKGIELNDALILDAIKKTNPLSRSRNDELDKMAAWAKINAVPASFEKKISKTTERKIKI